MGSSRDQGGQDRRDGPAPGGGSGHKTQIGAAYLDSLFLDVTDGKNPRQGAACFDQGGAPEKADEPVRVIPVDRLELSLHFFKVSHSKNCPDTRDKGVSHADVDLEQIGCRYGAVYFLKQILRPKGIVLLRGAEVPVDP